MQELCRNYIFRESVKVHFIGMHAQFPEGFINIEIHTKENPKQDEHILKATVGNEAASGCKLYLWMGRLLRACGHFLSWKALIFHAECVVQLNWLLCCV